MTTNCEGPFTQEECERWLFECERDYARELQGQDKAMEDDMIVDDYKIDHGIELLRKAEEARRRVDDYYYGLDEEVGA